MTKPQTEEARRKEILEALGSYQKRGRTEPNIKRLSDILTDESDRGVVVILGSMVEDLLLERLLRHFVSLTPAQKKNLTRGGGLLNSFDHRITLAQSLGLIDQEMVEMLAVLKAMRNACAHSRLDINFTTPELRNALTLLWEGETVPAIETAKVEVFLRFMFVTAVVHTTMIIAGHSEAQAQERVDQMISMLQTEAASELAKLKASREKRTKRQAKRPPSSPKD